MTQRPVITTFISALDQLHVAIDSGATHLILEDSKTSIRSFSDQFSDSTFSHIVTLAQEARSLFPSITLSANVDMIVHDFHFPLIHSFLQTLQSLEISIIRIQDPGLISFIQEHYPEAHIHLATETSNNNLESLRHYATLGVSRQIITNELPFQDILALSSIDTELELQVHGPILIQYSYRRFLHHHPLTNGDTVIIKHAQDQDLPNRTFLFLDNPHGHFMFAHFDRCLYGYSQPLKDLPLHAWLVDCRGCSLDYLKTAISAYHTLTLSSSSDEESLQLNALKSVSSRPLKPGFFVANKTDHDWRDFKQTSPNTSAVGKVIDTIKGVGFVIECYDTLATSEPIDFLTPEYKQTQSSLDVMKTLDSTQSIYSTQGHSLVKHPWIKGVCVGTQLYRS